MTFLLIVHLVLSLCGAAFVALFADLHAALSFGIGTGLMFGNFVVYAVVWPLILAKKLFALAVGVIVFKFAILAWILNMVATGSSVHVGWFSAGISLVVVSAVATAFNEAARSSSETEEGKS